MPFSSSFKPFSLLVTGAPGWLANAVLSRLGDALPALTRVRCLVQPSHSDESIAAWRRAYPSVREIVRGDLREDESLEVACASMSGGVLLHSAAIFHPHIPADWTAINRDGTVRLAEIAKRAGIKRFVFISSIAAQGAGSADTPLSEEQPCQPFSAYGKSKFEAEQALLRLHSPGEFEAVILRPGQFYGTPVPAHQVEFFQRVMSGKITLTGGGRFTRCLSHIDDLADGVVTALHHPRAAGTVFNLCDEKIYTEREIAEAVAEALDEPLEIASLPPAAAEIAFRADRVLLHFERYWQALHLFGESHRHMGAASAKARKVLGFVSKTEVREGMKRAVEWARGHNLIDVEE